MKDTVRIAIVGAMGKGGAHARMLAKMECAVLTAIVDHNPAVAALANELGVPFFEDIKTFLKAKVADAIICAVPHPAHRQVEIPCLEGGLHVLSEKPLAATPSDARAVVDAAKAAGKVLAMMFQYHQRPAVKKAKALLDTGAVGKWYYGAMHHGINRVQAYYDARAWRGTWAGEGGGVLVNQAPHPIEIMMFLAGGFPKRVVAFNSHCRHRMQTEDISTAVLEYDGGAQIMLHCDTIQLPTQECWSLHGDNGTIHIQDRQVTLRRITPDLPTAINTGPGTTKPAKVKVDTETFNLNDEDLKHGGMVEDFVDAVRGNHAPIVGGDWALRCVELHAAIITSAVTGKAVNFPPDHAEYDALLKKLGENR